MSDLKTLEEKYKALGEEIERLKNKPTERFWKPAEEVDLYLFVTGNYEVAKSKHTKTSIDCELIEGANCYRPEEKELAEKDAAKARARQIIQRTADQLHGYRYEFTEDCSNYFVYKRRNEIAITEVNYSYDATVYFKTKTLVEKCLELCRKEYEILLGVK